MIIKCLTPDEVDTCDILTSCHRTEGPRNFYRVELSERRFRAGAAIPLPVETTRDNDTTAIRNKRRAGAVFRGFSTRSLN